ncbi:hypothetical protein SEUCBS139899_001857 [Sporothrix eucalyptigena]
MFRKLKTHLGVGPASPPTSAAATPTRPKTYKHIPGLYPVGSTTIETYFRRLLEDPLQELSEDEMTTLLRKDIVAAAIHIARQEGLAPKALQLIPLLTRCITGTYEAVQFADGYFVEEEAVSALSTPLLLQILVAVAVKHRYVDMLRDLLQRHCQNKPETSLFKHAENFLDAPHGVMSDPNYGPRVWKLLVNAGWASPLSDSDAAVATDGGNPIDSEEACQLLKAAAAKSNTDPEDSLAILDDLVRRNLDPVPYTGLMLDVLAKQGTADMLAHYLPLISRKVYDGVPPKAKWPGNQSAVTMAAARRDEDGTGVLKVLVDLAGMDVHADKGIWYKAGPDDEHPEALIRSTRLEDGSHADDPPLLAAVQVGNIASVRFLLERGVAAKHAAVLDEALERARERGNANMVVLLEEWKIK